MPGHFHHSRRWTSKHPSSSSSSRRTTFKCYTLKATLLALAFLAGVIVSHAIFASSWLFGFPIRSSQPPPRCQTLQFASEDTYQNNTDFNHQYYAFAPVPIYNTSSLSQYRLPDISDTFANYTYRHHPKCSISSLSLHKAFSPLCPDRGSFLQAFTGGGRIGFDAPFIPRNCDMRWYTTEEICEILGRFEMVIVIGDSMMRHVIGAMNVLLRQDLGYGAVTGWNFGEEESEKCFCTHQMDVKACSLQGIFRTSDVLKHDPDSFACPHSLTKLPSSEGSTNANTYAPTSPVNLVIELMLKYPLDPTEITRLQSLLPPQRPRRPIAFVLGHGLWNDLDLQATVNWLDGILAAIYDAAPYLQPAALPSESESDNDSNRDSERNGKRKEKGKPMAYVLMVTPSAAGVRKPDQWITSQGDKALQIFEHSVRDEIYERDGRFVGRGVEHLGTWNMSVQMDKWDGVHLNLRGNLVKAMGVLNWLGGVEVERW